MVNLRNQPVTCFFINLCKRENPAELNGRVTPVSEVKYL